MPLNGQILNVTSIRNTKTKIKYASPIALIAFMSLPLHRQPPVTFAFLLGPLLVTWATSSVDLIAAVKPIAAVLAIQWLPIDVW